MGNIMQLNAKIMGTIFVIIVTIFVSNATINNDTFKPKYVPNEFTMDDLKIFDSEKELYLHLGMNRKEINKIYGNPEEIDMFGSHIYSGLKVFYRNQVAVKFSFSTSDNITSRYKTYRMVGLGDKEERVLDIYGRDHAKLSELYGANEITYVIKKKGKNIETEKKDDLFWYQENKENLYIIDFVSDGIVKNVIIGDSESITNLK
ncbi:hypothetical protein [Paenibacillus sp. CMAA1364]